MSGHGFTWIIFWIDEFNCARTKYFTEHQRLGVRILPASTGIGIRNEFGAAVVAGALAIKPKSALGCLSVREIVSPLQRSALEYRSSFSRAVEVNHGASRELYISGTASINAEGSTVHEGDIDQQISLSMDVVALLLRSRGMNWKSVTRAITYFKHPEGILKFTEWQRSHGNAELPLTAMHADICRPDLLFEIEVDAVEG